MNSDDDGFFEYNDHFPPLCIRPSSKTQEQEFKASMNGSLTHYLQESYRDGLKHEHSVLPNGMTAGEAGVLYFRNMHEKRRRNERGHLDVDRVFGIIQEGLKKYFNLDASKPPYDRAFYNHVSASYFRSKQMDKKLTASLKNFLTEISQKPKGYTTVLKNLVSEIVNKIQEEQKKIKK